MPNYYDDRRTTFRVWSFVINVFVTMIVGYACYVDGFEEGAEQTQIACEAKP